MENIKSTILETINNIATGIQKDSNARLLLLTQIKTAVDNNEFKLEVDLNREDKNSKKYKPNLVSFDKLNKITNSDLKYLRDNFQISYLGVNWLSKDKEQKAKIDALRDSFNAFIPMAKYGKDTLIKKSNSYFTGANNSKIRVNGNYVYEYCTSLNKDNITDVALNFSEVLRVARGYYKNENLGGGSRTNPFDSVIKRADTLLKEDMDSVKPFEMGSSKSEQLVSFLVQSGQKWLSELRKAREDISPKAKVEFSLNQVKKKTA